MLIDIAKLMKTYAVKIAEVIETRVIPHLKDDKDLTRLLKLAYRFIPFPVRFVVSKERFVDFIIAQKNRFFPNTQTHSQTQPGTQPQTS